MSERYPDHYNKEACELKHLQLEKAINELDKRLCAFQKECGEVQEDFREIDKKRDDKERQVEKDVRDQIEALGIITDNKIESTLCPIQNLLHDKKIGMMDRLENIEKILEKQQEDKEELKQKAWKVFKWIVRVITIIIILSLGGRWSGISIRDIMDRRSNNAPQVENYTNINQDNMSSGEKNE